MITVFDDFAGNETAAARVKNWISTGRVPQSIILEGPMGSGKMTLALLLAAGLFCTAGGKRPCGECVQCRKAFSGHPDLNIITDDRKEIGVDRVRTLRADACVAPNESSYKIYILTKPLTVSAQNALLKVMEEPPAGVVFLFLAERREQLLETVRSRSSLLTLSGVEPAEGIPALRKLFPELPDDRLGAALQENGLLIGRAIEALSGEQAEENAAVSMLKKMADALCADDPAAFLIAAAPMADDRVLQDDLTARLTLLLRDAAAARAGSDSCLSGLGDRAKALARKIPAARLTGMLETAARMNRRVSGNPNGGLFVSLLCSELFAKQQDGSAAARSR